ncbi:hypothetical protein H8E77_28115 [bacterium]|nr:hypothetical protein [bacterium]
MRAKGEDEKTKDRGSEFLAKTRRRENGKTRKAFHAFWLMLVMLLPATALAQIEPPSFNGYLRTYEGVLVGGEKQGDYAIVQNTLNLRWEQKRGKVGFYANPVLYHHQENSEQLDFIFRQAYLDLYFDSFDLRIGKQQIIWGKADGVFITDIISPKDFREFLLPDFDEIRIGVTAANLNYYLGNNTLQLVWVPVFQANEFPEANSLWAFQRRRFPVTPTFDHRTSTVPTNIDNSQIFARFAALTSSLDFELMAGYLFDATPTNHLTRVINPATGGLEGLAVRPEHHRFSIIGGSLAKTVAGVVVRCEGGFYRGKRFNTADLTVVDGVVETNFLHYLIGFDYNIFGIDVSGQFIQEVILDYDEAIQSDQFNNTGTFLMKQDFRRETLNAELFVYYGFNEGDALIRPKLTYDLADGFEVVVGANIFTGPQEGQFGQFNENDMAYTKVKYSF